MPNFFKTYFNFSQKEKRGVVVLLLLIALAYMLPTIYKLFREPKEWDYSEFAEQINTFIADIDTLEVKKEHQQVFFHFDPNTLNKKGFKKLGFSTKQIQTIYNYRKAGGTFYKPDDFKNIYGIPEELYKKIRPYIKIVQTKKIKKDTISIRKIATEINHRTKLQKQIVELNAADSAQLVSLSGIGPVFAKRIINYRNYLGGFYSSKQLSEVYGVNSELVSKLIGQIKVDTVAILKIDLNTIRFKELLSHPYFNYAQTKSVFKYKQLMGKFTSVNEIISNHLIDSACYYKVRPYLTVN